MILLNIALHVIYAADQLLRFETLILWVPDSFSYNSYRYQLPIFYYNFIYILS